MDGTCLNKSIVCVFVWYIMRRGALVLYFYFYCSHLNHIYLLYRLTPLAAWVNSSLNTYEAYKAGFEKKVQARQQEAKEMSAKKGGVDAEGRAYGTGKVR